MRWELKWGSEYQTLVEVFEVTGVMPTGLIERPQLRWHNRFYLESFYVLSNSRPIGMSAGPIPVSEVLAYCQMHGDFNPSERLRFLEVIRSLDAEYMAHVNAKK